MQYKKPGILFNTHAETIFPALLRKVEFEYTERERLTTEDSDFIDVDWFKQGSNKLTIICHGLEGSASRPYIKGMAKTFGNNGFDILAINYRGCSGEMNRLKRFYHSGATEDIKLVVDHSVNEGRYENIVMIGFSMGGNLVLKYLGETGSDLPKEISKAIVFSVPLLLEKSSLKLEKPYNYFYKKRFLKHLREKVYLKDAVFPDFYPVEELKTITTLFEFDELITAPIHGFKSASDYYTRSSSMFYLEEIQIPVKVVNSYNDTFIAKECFEVSHLNKKRNITFSFQEKGGHCGFASFGQDGLYWSELLALKYLTNKL